MTPLDFPSASSRLRLRFLLFAALLLLFVPPSFGGPMRAALQAKVDGGILVRYKSAALAQSARTADRVNRRALRRAVGGDSATQTPMRTTPLDTRLGIALIQVDPSVRDATIAALRRDPDVLYAERNAAVHASFVPNDTQISNQWALGKVSAYGAWDITRGSSSVIIAVIDSGADGAHPDLVGKLVPGYNFISRNTNTTDDNGHGTHCSGNAAGATNNGVGTAGAGFDARVMPLKMLDAGGSGSYDDLILAINYAASNGAKVISMSLGGPDYSQALQDAINAAFNAGLVVVASSGNNGNQSPNYPGAMNNVLCVASSDGADGRSGFSTYGSFVDVAAPGENILATARGGGYAYMSGTSMAAPIVSGEAALLFAVGGLSTKPQVIVDTIKSTQDTVTDPSIPGRVNFARAVAQMASVPTPVNNAAFVSQTVPTTMTAGQTYSVSVTMKNTGTTTWSTANGHRLGSAGPQDNTIWGFNRVNLPTGTTVAPNQNATFTFNVTAPSSAGTYAFQWRMVQDGVAWFGDPSTLVNVQVTSATGTPGNAAQILSVSVPTAMESGRSYSATVVVKNTGTTTWTSAGLYRLGSQSPQDNDIFGVHRVDLPGGNPVAPGDTVTFTFPVYAPFPGTNPFQWRMVQDLVEWFGDTSPSVSVTTTITNVPSPDGINSAQFVSQSVPTQMRAGQRYSVSITMKNVGTSTWTANQLYRLGSQSPQDNSIFGVHRVVLPDGVASVKPGETVTFTFTVFAPFPGTYAFQWQAVQDLVQWFGDKTPKVDVVVTS